MTETTKQRVARFAQIWSSSRARAGKTQEFMAKGLGVSKKTIQNWENGVTSPDFFAGSEWFRVLGINPLPYYLSFVFPELFEENDNEINEDDTEQALKAIIENSTPLEKRQLLYLMAGHHGSSWYSLLQMFTAHCHISMKSRVSIAQAILDSYEMEESTGETVCDDSVKPDIDILRRAVREGKKTVINGNQGYTNIDKLR